MDFLSEHHVLFLPRKQERLPCVNDGDNQEITVAIPGTGDASIFPMSLGSEKACSDQENIRGWKK